jgi:hypothetical protein
MEASPAALAIWVDTICDFMAVVVVLGKCLAGSRGPTGTSALLGVLPR